MKHKKHLRKQNSGRSSANAGESEEKDSSDYEDIQGDGDDEQDEEVDPLTNERYDSIEANCEKDGILISKKEGQLEKNIEGKNCNNNFMWLLVKKKYC